MNDYIFTSERLGFRNWNESDKSKMYAISSDPKVMEYFPSVQSEEQTSQFVDRMKEHFSTNGFCYYAVDRLDNQEFIGFIGIARQDFESDFTPCVDIGWRLAQKEWGKGYATEGAKKCLDYAFRELGVNNIKSICSVVNKRSENVMKKIGMKKCKEFIHPLLADFEDIKRCILYEIEKDTFCSY